jgi:hypothetical protein
MNDEESVEEASQTSGAEFVSEQRGLALYTEDAGRRDHKNTCILKRISLSSLRWATVAIRLASIILIAETCLYPEQPTWPFLDASITFIS